MPDSLVPPEARALVDQLVGDPQSATISRRESQRYAWAAGDLNPIYFDEAAARTAGYDGLVVPLTLLAGLWKFAARRKNCATTATAAGAARPPAVRLARPSSPPGNGTSSLRSATANQ